MIAVLQSPQILSRFEAILGDIRSRRGYHKVLISILILTVQQYPTTTDVLVDFWGDQVLTAKFRKDRAIRQLCQLSEGTIRFRSSIAAKFLLRNMSDPEVIVEVLTTMARSLDRLALASQPYQHLLRQLMQFSTLNMLLPEAKRRMLTITYYENIKNLQGCKKNPQFWLQYAIASLVLEELDRAERYFETSYSLARIRNNYPLHNIDNHYARFLLAKAIRDPLTTDYMLAFRQCRNILIEQMHHKERYHYPYRVATTFSDFFDAFGSKLSQSDRTEIVRAANEILRRIESLPPERRSHPDIDRCHDSMEYIVEMAKESSE